MILNTVKTSGLGMSIIPGISRMTPVSAGGGLAGMGDLTIGGTTLTTQQLLIIAVVAYFVLKR